MPSNVRKIMRGSALWLLVLGSFLAVFCVYSLAVAEESPSSARKKKKEIASLPKELHHYVNILAEEIGERHCYHPENLARTVSWLEDRLRTFGYSVKHQVFEVPEAGFDCKERTVSNIEAERKGSTRPDEIIIVGAHYDTRVAMPTWDAHSPPTPGEKGTPGADDNGSGVAAALALARIFADSPQERTLRFVFFVNEEPPFFQNPSAMGSWKYAARSKKRNEKIVAMISLETLGIYSKKAQNKRPWLRFFAKIFGLSSKPNYVAFLSNSDSKKLTRKALAEFKKNSSVLGKRLSLPDFSSEVAWSDDWAFWQEGYPAFSVTDTAYLRHDHYHELSDTADKLDYPEFAKVVYGLRHVITHLANGDLP